MAGGRAGAGWTGSVGLASPELYILTFQASGTYLFWFVQRFYRVSRRLLFDTFRSLFAFIFLILIVSHRTDFAYVRSYLYHVWLHHIPFRAVFLASVAPWPFPYSYSVSSTVS